MRIRLTKRIPVQAGLGGGSSDAAAALRVLAAGWRAALTPERLHEIAASLGADVPFFLRGGTALGLERGDLIYPLPDLPATWVTVVVPSFGVSTVDAYRWWDREHGGGNTQAPAAPRAYEMLARGRWPAGCPSASSPTTCRGLSPLIIPRSGGSSARSGGLAPPCAAMSGSGSAVFGLFASRRAAGAAARALDGRRATDARSRGRAGRDAVADLPGSPAIVYT